ncbi:translation initiation factor IF-2 [Galbibacter marinus]|uniref:Translation initiation factor IF-2 n=1 Tax=Galbibacter marinus TaxID=555500 RepID=K2Q1P1_9FLAO|nr:translation initiation factor IF-2 [Galbibacter marinus]EKF54741.1 translation initiation factor IF-2 [Galbibacter marinus]
MAESAKLRLNKVLRELNISLDRAVEHLSSKGFDIEARPTTKITNEVYNVLLDEFQTDRSKKVASKEVGEEKRKEKEAIRQELEKENELKRQKQLEEEQEIIRARATLSGPKTVGKIELSGKKKDDAAAADASKEEKPIDKVEEQSPSLETKPKTETKADPVEKEPIKEEKQAEEKTAKTETKKEEKPAEKTPEKSTEPVKDTKPEEVKKPQAPKAVETPKAPIKTKKMIVDDEVVDSEQIKTKYTKLSGPNFTGEKIDLSQFNKPKKKKETKEDPNKKGAKSTGSADDKKKRRRRISKDNKDSRPGSGNNSGNRFNKDNNKNRRKGAGQRRPVEKVEPTEEEVQKQVRETLEKLQGKASKSKGAKYRREKRDFHRQKTEQEIAQQEAESKTLRVTEFVTVSELATLIDVPVTKIISACMSLGMMVTMNQRLDAETLTIIAEEFGYEVEFITVDLEDTEVEKVDAPEDLESRAPVVTVMGHVDHGKTSLLDYIREENVIAGESGGITQHIGAYGVTLKNGQKITFLDTPGHEAFTAMRARGAQVTDMAIIVIAADDDVMPQTKEAISHAQAAGIPIVFAINKVDKPTANPDKIKEGLANMNLLVEDWGGKIQSQDISAKSGLGVPELLEKVLLEAELLELKANPNKSAVGAVVEAYLDKGRGYVSTVLVQGGTLKIGDYLLAGTHSGKVKAMQDERGNNIPEAGPSTPISVLGLDGAPQAGDKFNVYEDEKEAKQIAAKRTQLQREQSVRTQRHITLDEIGRRIALGEFKELNIILKGDVDGSVEALTDSFQKLSTEEIHINIIHKAVGPITESDVLLATASDAIIIGFNVRPMGNARSIADKEEIDIRTYSIIYDAINDLRDAMEGMLSPELKEEITGTAEIRETFKISKVGTIAGCMVTDGKIYRNSGIRLIRDGVVIFTGELTSLKRFKDDVKEVSKGYDCGLQVKNYNDIQIGDIVESFREVEVKKKL